MAEAVDMNASIVPKSEQLNADDLISGARTVTIVAVRAGTDEQPINVHLAEFPDRTFRPCKSVRRIMVAAWGPEASTYVGRRMTLHRDPTVKWGGLDVGGIRVSHLSHIETPLRIALTVTRGKRAPFVIQPLVDEPAPAPVADSPVAALRAEWQRADPERRKVIEAEVARLTAEPAEPTLDGE